MADDAELKLDNGGGKKKLFIIIGAVVLLVVVGVVVFMMMGSSEPQESEQTQQLLAESNKIFYVSRSYLPCIRHHLQDTSISDVVNILCFLAEIRLI